MTSFSAAATTNSIRPYTPPAANSPADRGRTRPPLPRSSVSSGKCRRLALQRERRQGGHGAVAVRRAARARVYRTLRIARLEIVGVFGRGDIEVMRDGAAERVRSINDLVRRHFAAGSGQALRECAQASVKG